MVSQTGTSTTSGCLYPAQWTCVCLPLEYVDIIKRCQATCPHSKAILGRRGHKRALSLEQMHILCPVAIQGTERGFPTFLVGDLDLVRRLLLFGFSASRAPFADAIDCRSPQQGSRDPVQLDVSAPPKHTEALLVHVSSKLGRIPENQRSTNFVCCPCDCSSISPAESSKSAQGTSKKQSRDCLPLANPVGNGSNGLAS